MSNRSKIAQNKLNRQNIKIAAFNCKNVITSTPAINELFETHDIILLQEHWLFEFQLHLLEEIGADISYIGKAVDMNNNNYFPKTHIFFFKSILFYIITSLF
jgi:hypothetical protein